MSSIERQISVTRGPFFFEQDGELMFQFACDNSTIIGPYAAKPSHLAEYPDALKAFRDAQANGEPWEPEFVARERQEKPKTKGLTVLDMIEGRTDDEFVPDLIGEQAYTPGETPAVQVGTVGRKADPIPYGNPPIEAEGAISADEERALILAELDMLGAPTPHHRTGIVKLRELLAVAKEG